MKFQNPEIKIFLFGVEDVISASIQSGHPSYWGSTSYPWLPECPAELPMD